MRFIHLKTDLKIGVKVGNNAAHLKRRPGALDTVPETAPETVRETMNTHGLTFRTKGSP